jgi:hypothetical protein
MPAFIPGRELSRQFYQLVVRPILDQSYRDLPHAAGHLGSGSDVLGFDTAMSRDHDWGPACALVLREQDEALAEPIRALMASRLPHTFLGYAVDIREAAEGPIQHRVLPITLSAFVRQQLGWPALWPGDPADWLSTPSQLLRALAEAAVHHDGVGELTALRERVAWYPHDIWLYLMICGWQRIGQEDHLMSRAGFVGDELGSGLIGSRLVRDLMALCFLIERRYAPYPKWFGSAFGQLACSPALAPILWRAQTAQTWRERETALCEAGVIVVRMHNALGLTEPVDELPQQFFDRPFQVIGSGRLIDGLLAQISDPGVRSLADRTLIGGIDQWSDNTDLRSNPAWHARVRELYG